MNDTYDIFDSISCAEWYVHQEDANEFVEEDASKYDGPRHFSRTLTVCLQSTVYTRS